MNDPGQSDYRAGALVAVLCYVYKRRVFHVGHQLLLPGFLSLDIMHNGLTDAPLLPPAYLILLSTEEVMDDDTPLALGKPHFLSPPPLTWDQHGAAIVDECICCTDSSFSLWCPQT